MGDVRGEIRYRTHTTERDAGQQIRQVAYVGGAADSVASGGTQRQEQRQGAADVDDIEQELSDIWRQVDEKVAAAHASDARGDLANCAIHQIHALHFVVKAERLRTDDAIDQLLDLGNGDFDATERAFKRLRDELMAEIAQRAAASKRLADDLLTQITRMVEQTRGVVEQVIEQKVEQKLATLREELLSEIDFVGVAIDEKRLARDAAAEADCDIVEFVKRKRKGVA
jgi:hypothetical protein